MCEKKGKRLCYKNELCVNNKPRNLLKNIFEDSDNWMPVNDETNQWVTYRTAENRQCKTHTEVDGGVPGWGNNNARQLFYKAAKCCKKEE